MIAFVLCVTLTTLTVDPVIADQAAQVAGVAFVALQPAEPVPAPSAELLPEASATDPINIFHPKIHYRVRGHCKPCCLAKPPVKTTLLVRDPESCDCYAEVPVCIPCCCEGEAQVCNRPGILGRRWVDHDFACGFQISVLFRTRGDVVVVYRF